MAFDIVARRGIRRGYGRRGGQGLRVQHVDRVASFRDQGRTAFQYLLPRQLERLLSIAGTGPAAPLVDCFSRLLPMDEVSRRMWQVWLACWPQAHLDPRYGEERRRSAENGAGGSPRDYCLAPSRTADLGGIHDECPLPDRSGHWNRDGGVLCTRGLDAGPEAGGTGRTVQGHLTAQKAPEQRSLTTGKEKGAAGDPAAPFFQAVSA